MAAAGQQLGRELIADRGAFRRRDMGEQANVICLLELAPKQTKRGPGKRHVLRIDQRHKLRLPDSHERRLLLKAKPPPQHGQQGHATLGIADHRLVHLAVTASGPRASRPRRARR